MTYFSFSPVTDDQEKQDKHTMTFPTQVVILNLKQPAALSQQHALAGHLQLYPAINTVREFLAIFLVL